jgi:hypothetical protein
VAGLTLVLALITPPAIGVNFIDPGQHLEAGVKIAEYVLANEDCDTAFGKLYRSKKKGPMLDIFNQLHIAVIDIPDLGPGPNTAMAVLPEVAPRTIFVDLFWLVARSPLETGLTFVHETVHLLDYSLLPEKEWKQLSLHEKEVRAERVAEQCRRGFFAQYPEMSIDD